MQKNSDNFQNETDYKYAYNGINSASTQPSAPPFNTAEEEPMLTTNEQKKRLSKKWIYRLSIFLLVCIIIAIILLFFLTGITKLYYNYIF